MEEELRGRFGAGGPARTLSAAARRTAAEVGLRLRAFARDGDRLWLPAPLGPESLRQGPEGTPGLPEVVVESGPIEALPPVERLLAWGEGPRVAALRERWGARPEVDEARALAVPLHEAVWHLPVASPEVVARVAHRGFGLELARDLGRDERWALPGAGWAASLPELEHHLGLDRAGEAAGWDDGAGAGRWVVKAPFSAAGRERFLGAGPGDLVEPPVRRRIEGLLERHGRLLVEPWVERSADFGAAGLLTSGGVRLASIHRQEVDLRGGFRGIAATSPDGAGVGLSPAERDLLEEAFQVAAEALRGAGYLGPFGIDAFRWRRPCGGEAFHPLCEINPRLTFGLVARAFAERGG